MSNVNLTVCEEWRRAVLAVSGRAINQNDDVLRRFFAKVEVEENGCWLWAGTKAPYGYGRFSFEGEPRYAHRLMYVWVFGSLSSGNVVCHSCDCPSCVNPAHFFMGTQADNMRDRDQKGRGYRKIKMVPEDIELKICDLLRKRHLSHKSIAARFDLSYTIVRNIGRKHGIPVHNGRTNLTPYQEDEIIARLQKGEPLRSIALSYGLSKAGVQGVAKRCNISISRGSPIKRKVSIDQEREIFQLHSGGIKQIEIAKMYKLSPSGVRDILNRNKKVA